MAAPGRWRERAVRFAELYVDPAHGNYDPEHRIIRRPHNGSDPDRTGLFDGTHYPWLEHEERLYGFPLDWLVFDGRRQPPREADPRLAGEMTARLGVGDTAVNLASAGLVLNAWILTGEQRYRDWIGEYVGAWRERAAANGGVIPDNVGPDGVVGSLLDGRWYGGHYGWSWPHGWYSVGQAATVGALAAAAATGDQPFLDLVRPALDTLIGEGQVKPFAESDSSLAVEVVPAAPRGRRGADVSRAVPALRPRLVRLQPADARGAGGAVASQRRPGGPEPPNGPARNGPVTTGARSARSAARKRQATRSRGSSFLAGEHPEYPEQILAAAQAQVRHRLARGRAYRDIDIAEADIHVWQQCNPVVTEALVQLTWGGPQVIYNGGMQQARVRYYDGERRRPGLPDSVAALVSAIDPEATVVDLVNLDPEQDRTVIVQAGAFAEHTIEEVRYTACPDPSWMGGLYDYGHGEPVTAHKQAEVGGPWLTVRLPASTQIRADHSARPADAHALLRDAVRRIAAQLAQPSRGSAAPGMAHQRRPCSTRPRDCRRPRGREVPDPRQHAGR